MLEGMKSTRRTAEATADAWRREILWVDDNPDNNIYERNALESVGIEFTLATSTREALDILSRKRFAAIISDMGRKEGPREGYVLLETIRAKDAKTPFFIYAGSNAPEHKREALARGAQAPPACLRNSSTWSCPRLPLVRGRDPGPGSGATPRETPRRLSGRSRARSGAR